MKPVQRRRVPNRGRAWVWIAAVVPMGLWVSVGVTVVIGCRDQESGRGAHGPVVQIPVEPDVLAAANAAGTTVIAPPIIETDEPLEPEADAIPREPVNLLLTIVPVGADIFWGGKRIGVSKPGTPVALSRPRNSGPLDLLIRAPGFLPYHTRLFTDRDDKLTVSLRKMGTRAVP